MIHVTLAIVQIFIIFILVFIFLNTLHKYWKHRQIPHLQPEFIFGNAADLCLGRKSMLDYQNDLYSKLKRGALGVFMFYKPTLYIGDVSWVNCILNKDFRNFMNRGLNFDTDNEPLTRHLFHLEGQLWKNVRQKVTPTFTPDGLKVFLPMLLESARKLTRYLDDIIATQTNMDLDLKDIISKYAADIIGSCAYGIDSGALSCRNTKFYKMSKKIFSPRLRTIIKLIFPKLPNFIVKLFDIKMVETRVSNYFISIIEKQLEFRRCSEEKQPNDFLTFMMKVQEDSLQDEFPITDDLIMAQCFMFFIAGYENTSGVVCAALYELADHLHIQEKLYEEIKDILGEGGINELTYEKVNSMNYLDMVVNEIIRIYPPATALIRECHQDYTLPGTNWVLQKGLQIVIPVCGIHRDPLYYPYPEQFNPENFSYEAKVARPRCAYIPFGDGPRYCIGRKFGIAQVKVAIICLLYNFKFLPSPKMKHPLTFEKQTFITSIEGGIWIKAKQRNVNF